MRNYENRDIPVHVLVYLCEGCAHQNNCVEPLIREAPNNGVTCASFDPVPSPSMVISPDALAALPDREPCSGCACRKGTEANGTHHTKVMFDAAVDRKETFFCHGDGAGRVCGGWLRAVRSTLTREDV